MSDHAYSDEEVLAELSELNGWEHENNCLNKTFRFPDFVKAFEWMTKVAAVAEEQQHHPDWKNVYNQVEVNLNTHDLGGKVGPKDFTLAKAMDEAYGK